MGALGFRSAQGLHSTANKFTPGTQLWVVTFAPKDLPVSEFEVYHGSIRGPGGYFLVYLDDALYGVAENGTVSEYAPTIPMYVRPGQTITLNWSINTGVAPQAWLYLRTPEIGRL
jgi:hypothetical protein